MTNKLETFIKPRLKTDLPDIRSGDTVRVMQKIKEGDKERIQMFEGLVLARKHGKEAGATIIVRKIISGVGVEKTFPLHSPAIERIEIIKRGKVRRAKLYYLRGTKGKKAKLKQKEFTPRQNNAELAPYQNDTGQAGERAETEKEPEKKITAEIIKKADENKKA